MLYYFRSIFSSSPRVLLVSFKKFYCHCAVGRTIGKTSGPGRRHRCHHHEVTEGFGPVALITDSKLDLIYSPQNVVQTLCQLLRGCHLWWLHRRGGPVPGLGTLPSDTSGFAGRWNWDQHRAGRLQQNERKRSPHCAQQKKLSKMMSYEIISLSSTMVLPPRKEPKEALARFNCYLKGKRCLLSPPPFFLSVPFFVF